MCTFFLNFLIETQLNCEFVQDPNCTDMTIEMISRQTMYIIPVLLLAMAANLVQSDSAPSSCASKLTCHECIQTKSCSWCLQPDYGDKPRCFQPSHDKSINNCAEEYTWNPDNEQRLVIHEELTRGASISGGGGQSMAGGSYEASSSKGSWSKSGSSYESYSKQHQHSESHNSRKTAVHTSYGEHSESGHIVQIYPQRVNLKLRISMFTPNLFSFLNFCI